MKLLLAPAPREREAHIEHMVSLFKAFSGPGFAFDETWTRTLVTKAFDRSFYPEGTARQVLAVISQPDRRKDLVSVTVPTLVIHGTNDPLLPVEAGVDTVQAIPNARLLLIEGMGHDLPHGGAWPKIVDAIAAHISKVTS